METKDVKKTFWRDAARYGGIIGVAMIMVGSLGSLMSSGSLVNTVLQIGVVAGLLYWTLKKRADKYGNEGFSYGQCMGYIMAMMLFAGIIFGAYSYGMANAVSPETFEETMEEAMEQAMDKNPMIDEDTAEMGMAMAKAMARNPIFHIFSGVFMMILYGALVGLVVAAFTKRNPDIFADTNDRTDGDFQA